MHLFSEDFLVPFVSIVGEQVSLHGNPLVCLRIPLDPVADSVAGYPLSIDLHGLSWICPL
jgi:hypothetical protein